MLAYFEHFLSALMLPVDPKFSHERFLEKTKNIVLSSLTFETIKEMKLKQNNLTRS